MKKWKRQIQAVVSAAVMMFCAAAPIAAQNAKSSGITDADVKAFVKNFDSIQEELDRMDIEFDDFWEDTGTDIKPVTKIEAMLQKNGISGPNRIQKITAIGLCFAVEFYTLQMNTDPEAAAMIKSLDVDPMIEIRPRTNENDCAVVRAYVDRLARLFGAYAD